MTFNSVEGHGVSMHKDRLSFSDTFSVAPFRYTSLNLAYFFYCSYKQWVVKLNQRWCWPQPWR